MSHTIFATTTTAGLLSLLETLQRAGYRSDEVSLLTTVAGALSAGETLAWWAGLQRVCGQGRLTAHLRQGGATTLAEAFEACGMPAYAIRHCEAALGGGGVLVAVHTANGFEVEPLADLLHAGGGQHVVATADLAEIAA